MNGFMRSFLAFLRPVLLLAFLFMLAAPVSGWTMTNWTAEPARPSLSPGSPVSVSFGIHIDSWMEGTTFTGTDTLLMATDLSDARWSMEMSDIIDESQAPVVTSLGERQGSKVRLDGWTLSYSNKRFDLNVEMTGVMPDADRTREIALVRIRELDENAKAVYGKTIEKTVELSVPATVATTTSVPAVTTTEPAVTAHEESPSPASARAPAAQKTTYTPLPGPLEVCGLLAAFCTVTAVLRR